MHQLAMEPPELKKLAMMQVCIDEGLANPETTIQDFPELAKFLHFYKQELSRSQIETICREFQKEQP